MLRVNKVKIHITTSNGIYGVEETFSSGLNFIASKDNTCGKSSILAAIYYGLGLEEIIGGKGEKVLTSVFKTTVEDGDSTWSVLDSAVFLEISNGKNIVTLYRSAVMENRDSRMITVYYSSMDEISNSNVPATDMYIHFPNSTKNEKGFHAFLESFLFLELPFVSSSDNSQRKLYLQLIFSGLFIEQKNGWSGLFSGMPILGIKESKKRVIEFLLKLDTLENEKLREKLKIKEEKINNDWKNNVNELMIATNRENCYLLNIPVRPRIVKIDEWNRVLILGKQTVISDEIKSLELQLENIKKLKPKIIDNFDELQLELNETESDISKIEDTLSSLKIKLQREEGCIKIIFQNLETIKMDLINNKDAARLRNLGSDIGCSTFKDICPICKQHIQDSLLPLDIEISSMSVDENILHLEAQKEMLEFALSSHNEQKEILKKDIENIQTRLFTLRRLAKSIRSDIYSTDEDFSESIIYKKISIEKDIDSLISLQNLFEQKLEHLKNLSSEWLELLEQKKKLPKERTSGNDKKKIEELRRQFIRNLKIYGYKSMPSLDTITISEETYLPIFGGFDIKFDSSASDNIRVIWAFTMALMQVSLKFGGNHPSILIFDEPDQQSTIITDMDAFFKDILSLSNKSQIIIGITVKDSDTKTIINNLDAEGYKLIDIPYKSMKLITKY